MTFVEDGVRSVAPHARTSDTSGRTAQNGATPEQITAILESIGDAFYAVDANFCFTYINRKAESLWGRCRESLLGKHFWDEFPLVVGSEAGNNHLKVMAEREPMHFETVSPILGRWIDTNLYPDAWSGGLVCYFRDIEDRKRGEVEREQLLAQLQAERARLEAVFQRAPSFIVAYTGPEFIYEFVNEAYYRLIGPRDVLGRPLAEAIPEIRDQGFLELLQQIRLTGQPWEGREIPLQLQRTPGALLEIRYIDVVIQLLPDADGTRSLIIAHGSDVTEQVLARREIERVLAESERARADAEVARAEAEAANRAKSEFLAMMSHELRTPLNAIGGYTELMDMGLHGPISKEQHADLVRIQQSQRHLLGLINQVLNYTRVGAGVVHYDLETLDVNEALVAAEALVVPQTRAGGLTYVLEQCPPDIAVRADREKLQQILLNLLSNAIKFTEATGEIRVSCVVQDAVVKISVADTGVGIPAEKLADIFEPFMQVDQRLTRPHEGVGLGLAISRDLARGMNGELSVASTLGKGSTFTLTLPRA